MVFGLSAMSSWDQGLGPHTKWSSHPAPRQGQGPVTGKALQGLVYGGRSTYSEARTRAKVGWLVGCGLSTNSGPSANRNSHTVPSGQGAAMPRATPGNRTRPARDIVHCLQASIAILFPVFSVYQVTGKVKLS